MKKLLIILMVLFLFGCKNKNSENSANTLKTFPYNAEQQITTSQNITIYQFNEATLKLENKIVPVTIHPDQSKAEAALAYLLTLPEFDFALNSYNIPDYSIITSGGIAKVNITNAYNENDKFKSFALHFSIVNTLCSIEEINYVSVFAGNSELCQGVYVGPSRFLEKDLVEYNLELYGRGAENSLKNTSSQRSMLLYYEDKSHNFVIPEQHSLYVNINNKKETINAIIAKLSASPRDSASLVSSVSRNLTANSVVIKNDTATIDLNQDPSVLGAVNKNISLSSLFYSITDVYPSIANISFSINGNLDDSYKGINDNSFESPIGTAITLYLTKISKDSLYPVSRFIGVNSSTGSTQIIQALIDGSTVYDSEPLISPIFNGLTINNLISTKIVNDIVIINFDIEFYNKIKNLNKKEESIMIYSIVNSLTEREEINRVQFLINGESFETINGHINYKSPIINNPGIALR